VIFFAGATFRRVGQEISVNELAEYLRIQLVNPVNVIGRLINYLNLSDSSNLLYMSSRAATFGSADWPYGIAKAGIQNYISSLSQFQKPPISILSIVSGLILGSSMQNEMSSDTLNSHITRAHAVGENLLTLDEIAQLIWALDPNSTLNLRGSVLSLGPVY
jgi:short-subunit dehydrogenase involved in D-alanine esterification of teichoic acids